MATVKNWCKNKLLNREKTFGYNWTVKIIKNLPENFLVLNGDILTNINFKKYYNLHIKNNKNLSVCTFQRKQKIDYGILEMKKIYFKILKKTLLNLNVSMGIYFINKKI